MQVPGNELAASFIETLQIRDIRYSLEYYGSFLHDIPRRLGTSAPLDAAVKALVASYPFFHNRDFPPEALIYHGRSLRVLRESLNDPVEARSANTLCAVYLITICQVILIPPWAVWNIVTNAIRARVGLGHTMISSTAMERPFLTF